MIRFIKNTFLVLLLLLISFGGYIAVVNVNSKSMTVRQMILKATYPIFMWWSKSKQINTQTLSNTNKKSTSSFYSLSGVLNNGEEINFSTLKGKKIMLVNTASDCGYTKQYDDLQKLYLQYNGELVIMGFPANDFKEQEKGTDEEIASFCKLNYGVTFPIMKKSSVKKGAVQSEIYKWLTNASQNGWNDKPPTWNFCKYIVDENGELTHFFGATISPMSEEVKNAIGKN